MIHSLMKRIIECFLLRDRLNPALPLKIENEDNGSNIGANRKSLLRNSDP